MNLISVLQRPLLPQPSSLSPNTTVPALQKYVLQKPLWWGNRMNSAYMTLISFKKEWETAVHFQQGSPSAKPFHAGLARCWFWSRMVHIFSVYLIHMVSCSALSQYSSRLFRSPVPLPPYKCLYFLGLSHLLWTSSKDVNKCGLGAWQWGLGFLGSTRSSFVDH